MIFSTVHKSKGMEYDVVFLADDFITKEMVKKLYDEANNNKLLIDKINEEINLLYVAVTRAKLEIKISKKYVRN